MTHYRCPVCGVHDGYAYLSCQWPGCPDGRDPRPKVFSPDWTPIEKRVAAHFPDEDAILRLSREMDVRYRNRRFVRGYVEMLAFLLISLLVFGALFGCATTPDPSARIGPYDITLSSHRDALR